MIKRLLIGGALAGIIAIALIGYAFFKTPEEASQTIAAIPLAVQTSAPVTPTSATAAAPAATNSTAPTTAPTLAAAPTQAAAGTTIFEIVQAESQAQFKIDEVLEGAPKTVLGITDQVAGQIALDPTNPAATQVGIIQVNARTLTTDNNMRNRAIKNRILLTNDHEFITFAPTELVGLPATGAVGQTYSFQIVGDLTIKGVTRPATFDVTVTAASAQRLEGQATSTIRYADFDVAVPSVPMVANVADEVQVALNFVAAPQN